MLSGTNSKPPEITRLEMNSPAFVVFEADASQARFERFFSDLVTVVQDGTAPPFLSRNAFDALKAFSAPVGRGIASARLSVLGKEVTVDIAARRRIEAAFGSDTSSEGTVDGMLEAVNLHGKKNAFALYPVVGAKRITCHFAEHLLPKVRPALGQYVSIQGELKYRWRERFPYEALATDLQILPDWDEQPSFEEIIGLAPKAANGIASEEFTRLVRNG